MRTVVDAIIIDHTTYHQVKQHEGNPPNIDTYDYWADGDYVTHAVYVVEQNAFLYLNDNTHGNPEAFIEGVMAILYEEHRDVARINGLIVLDNPSEWEYDKTVVADKVRKKFNPYY